MSEIKKYLELTLEEAKKLTSLFTTKIDCNEGNNEEIVCIFDPNIIDLMNNKNKVIVIDDYTYADEKLALYGNF